MLVKIKKSLSMKLQMEGHKPLATDVDYDTYKMDKPIGAYVKTFNKSDYIITNGLSFVNCKEVK